MALISSVNLLQGTFSTKDFSRGNTLPLLARPWGLHHWTLQTGRSPWTFHGEHAKLQGVRLTHQPSPWMRDYGNLLILPFHGEIQGLIEHQASAYSIAQTELRPHCLRAELLRYGIRLEMAPTERGAVFIFTRQSSEAIRVRFHFDGDHSMRWNHGDRMVIGASHNHCGGVADPFGLHFVGEFDVVPVGFEKIDNGGILTFPGMVERLELRLTASFISEEIARVSLRRELQGKSLSTVAEEGADIWNELLGRIEIEPRDESQWRTFYSCLYRCLLFPRFLDEVDSDGRTVHYSPYDGRVRDGSLCADSGFWDTYRTLLPLLALAYPEKLRLMLDGWLAACRESGWSPKWPSPGLRDCMIGTHFNVVVADAIAKGITDWNVEEAFQYLWKDATVQSDNGCCGRQGLEDYIRLGYVPCDKFPYGVSSTLDYCYDDFCVARVAQFLGRKNEANIMLTRAQAYRNVFDPSIGFMRGRRADGCWETPFREFRWGGSYIEGGPWQHTFNVPHDPAGLASLFGGQSNLCLKLDTMLATPPRFETGHYGYEIHEMTEMAMVPFGQYAHSNQPVHNFLFLYALSGQPEKTEHWVRRIAGELYSAEHLPGDEDNGEMSAWYIFASLGLYPFCPGTPDYVRFTPLVRSAHIAGRPVSEIGMFRL